MLARVVDCVYIGKVDSVQACFLGVNESGKLWGGTSV